MVSCAKDTNIPLRHEVSFWGEGALLVVLQSSHDFKLGDYSWWCCLGDSAMRPGNEPGFITCKANAFICVLFLTQNESFLV